MSEPRRKGRLFRDEPKEPPREQPKETEKSNSPLVRQTDHTLPPHDGSFKSELKPESKPQQRPVPSPQEKERPPPPSSPPAQLPMQTQKPRPPQEAKSQELDARSTMISVNTETKKNFRFVEKWMEVYGLKKTSEASRRADVDLYRETPVRFLGYSEEVGEALRPFIPKLIVRGSYLMTSVYILADTMDKTVKTSEARWETKKIRQREIEKALIDTLAWQGLASIIIPGILINRTCYVILYVMGLKQQLPRSLKSLTTASICLSLIPTVARPIDKFVDYFLDHTLRRMLKRRQPPY